MCASELVNKDNVGAILDRAMDAGGGLLRLTPTWVPRSFLHPDKRIKLAPTDWYALGVDCGGIDERSHHMLQMHEIAANQCSRREMMQDINRSATNSVTSKVGPSLGRHRYSTSKASPCKQVGLPKNTFSPSQRAFLVHGRDEAAVGKIARFMENVGVSPLILSEQPNDGRTIIEKLEAFPTITYAVVLLTPDDVGGLAGSDNLRARPRQNVVFELGYFIAGLGRDRVCALCQGDLELPSDFAGVLYLFFDDNEGWKLKLARELKNAGFKISLDNAA